MQNTSRLAHQHHLEGAHEGRRWSVLRMLVSSSQIEKLKKSCLYSSSTDSTGITVGPINCQRPARFVIFARERAKIPHTYLYIPSCTSESSHSVNNPLSWLRSTASHSMESPWPASKASAIVSGLRDRGTRDCEDNANSQTNCCGLDTLGSH